MADLLMSKTNSGFLIKLTQNLRASELFFHVWRTSESDILEPAASSSRKSNRYLMGTGRESVPGVYPWSADIGEKVVFMGVYSCEGEIGGCERVKMLLKRSSTND